MSVITLTDWLQEDMQLRGFAARTQTSYLHAVNGLAAYPRQELRGTVRGPLLNENWAADVGPQIIVTFNSKPLQR